MDIEAFIGQFADAVEFERGAPVARKTRFEDLEEWDSLAALSTIAMIFAEYGVMVSAEELTDCPSVGDLFDVVLRKSQAQVA